MRRSSGSAARMFIPLVGALAWLAGCGDTSGPRAPSVAGITISPDVATLTSIGSSVQLTATAVDASGNPAPGVAISWQTQNPAVLTVDSRGMATAVGNGVTTVTASAGGSSASAAITVAQEVVSLNVVAPQATLVSIGEQVQLTARALDARGNQVPNIAPLWSSSAPGVLAVDAAGRTTAIANGTADIRAALGAVVGTVAMAVEQLPVALIFDVQPTDAMVGNELAPRPQIGVVDGLGVPVEAANIAVSLGIGANPSGGALVGTTTESTTGGSASFSLALNRAGRDYTLVATAGGLPQSTSQPFNIAPEPVEIGSLSKGTNAVGIIWGMSPEPTFGGYTLYRGTNPNEIGEAIATGFGATDTAYTDSAVTLGTTYSYRVGVQTADSVETVGGHESIEAGIAVTAGADVEAMLVDPNRPLLYALSRTSKRLFFVDVASRSVSDSLFVGMDPTDLSIDASGDTLLVINYATHQLTFVDLETRTVARSFNFSIPGNHSQGLHYHVVAGRPGRAYYVDAAWDPRVHVLDTATGADLGSFNFDGVGDIAISSDHSTLFVWRQFGWGAGNINSWVTRVDATSDSLVALQSGTTNVGRDPLDTPIILSSMDTRVYTKRWVFRTSDLDVVQAVMPENIYAVTPDGRRIVTDVQIYDGATGLPVATTPLASTEMVVTPDGATLLLRESDSGRIFFYDLTAIVE